MWWFKKKKDDQEPATQAEPQEPGLNAGELTGGLKFSDNEPSLGTETKSGEVKIGEPVRFDNEPAPETALKAEAVKGGEASSDAAPHDDFEREQKRVSLRRRFIGAAMILAAVAVVSPFLFDKGEPPPSITIPLSIPNENGADVASLDVPGKGAAPAPNKQLAAKAPAPKAEAKKSEVKKSEVKKAAEKPAAKAEPKVEPKAEAKKETKPAAKPEVKKEVKSAAVAAAPAKGSFFIQLVATSDAAKAEALKRQVAASGLPVYTEQIASKTGKVTRVRVGPFKTQDAANEAKAALGMSGIASGNVQQVK